MNGRYLYCIVPPEHSPPAGLRGIDGAPVHLEPVSDLACWTSPLSRPPRPTADALRAHDRVARAAVAPNVSPLPARFGQWFSDVEALHAHLLPSAPEFARALARVAGAVEFGMRLRGGPAERSGPGGPPAGAKGPGAAYLRSVAEASANAEVRAARDREIGREISEALATLVVESRYRATRDGGVAEEFVHLVRLPDVEAFRSAVSALGRADPDLSLVLTGPWPPYSFTP